MQSHQRINTRLFVFSTDQTKVGWHEVDMKFMCSLKKMSSQSFVKAHRLKPVWGPAAETVSATCRPPAELDLQTCLQKVWTLQSEGLDSPETDSPGALQYVESQKSKQQCIIKQSCVGFRVATLVVPLFAEPRYRCVNIWPTIFAGDCYKNNKVGVGGGVCFLKHCYLIK